MGRVCDTTHSKRIGNCYLHFVGFAVFAALLSLLAFIFFHQFCTCSRCDFLCVDFVSCGGSREVGVFRQRVARIVPRTIQVRHKSAHNDKMLKVLGAHLADGFSGNAFVIDGHSAPSRFALFFLPGVDAAKAAMIVVAEPPEVVERGHFQVWSAEYVRQFLSDGIKNSNSCLLSTRSAKSSLA